MNSLTREWVDKAEADFQTVQRELRARKCPNLDGACFHAQQCIEKYLKARLQEAGIPFPKIHDLSRLLDVLLLLLHLALARLLDRLGVRVPARKTRHTR